ncbi:hypothetical protein SJAV_21410 [Sulfurisphaera javensis]|uniref:Uncharacterized protein n=1 Tax=Sulfurisphaera javensis TaxID=2049879 RepID=A0AAT9GUC4_9CREN
MYKILFKNFLNRSLIRDLMIIVLILVLFLVVFSQIFFFEFITISILNIKNNPYGNMPTVELNLEKALVAEKLTTFFGMNNLVPFGTMYVSTGHGGVSVFAIASPNLTLAMKVFNVQPMLFSGNYPSYGVYLVQGALSN